jgi:hypothetical protein
MCTVVPVMLRYVYCCTCNVEICILLSTVETDFYEGGGAGGSQTDAYYQQQIYSS